MARRILKLFFIAFFAALTLAPRGAAQTADKVKLDVLSALSTPLPITIVGPLLTRDVVVTEEDGGFRAVLLDTTLMGLFPFGEVSMKLEPMGEDSYRVTDLQFPKSLDFPGIGTVTFSGMTLDGTWSAATRSYETLTWVTDDLKLALAPGGQGTLEMGQLGFDVMKEPDETDTESRFEITVQDLAVLGMAPENIAVGELRALLTANGEKPVDLYSLIREVILLSSVSDGGAQLQTLGNSLLGNSYSTVALDLSARDLSVVNTRRPDESYWNARAMSARASLADVEPRHWGGVDVVLSFDDVDQREYLPDSAVAVENAVIRVSGGDLPVADILATFTLLANPPRNRSVAASSLLDGLAEFGKLEFSTEGKKIWVEGFDTRMDEDGQRITETAFEIGYDAWSFQTAMTGLNKNQGKLSLGTEFLGGRFVPGQRTPDEADMHIEAWFPVGLRLQSSVSNLNEGMLKQMFTDVVFRDLSAPVEAVFPLVLWAAAAVFDVTSGEDFYETALFRVSQSGKYRFYPTELLNLVPYEGQAEVRLRGLDGLLGYLDAAQSQVSPYSDEAIGLSAAKSALIVMRNIAGQEAGELTWRINRHDVTRREIELNGITLRYPNVMEYLPMLFTLGIR